MFEMPPLWPIVIVVMLGGVAVWELLRFIFTHLSFAWN